MSDAIWNETAWMVRVPGTSSIVGPVSLDQVRRGLAHEKLDRAAEIARDGSNEWRNAGSFVSEMMTRHGPPTAASAAHVAAPSVEMSQYPDRPPPPPYAAGPAPGPGPVGKASIRGLFPTAGRGKPPPPPDFRALHSDIPPADQTLPSEQLPLPAPPPRGSRGGPPPARPPAMPPASSAPAMPPVAASSAPAAGATSAPAMPPSSTTPISAASPAGLPGAGPPNMPGSSAGAPPLPGLPSVPAMPSAPVGAVSSPGATGMPSTGAPPWSLGPQSSPSGAGPSGAPAVPGVPPVAGGSQNAAPGGTPHALPAGKPHALPAPLPPKGKPAIAPGPSSPFSPAPSVLTPQAEMRGASEPDPSTRIAGTAVAVAIEREPISTTIPSPFDAVGPRAAAAMTTPGDGESLKALGLTPTSDGAKASHPGPETLRDPRCCARCGADAMLEGATLGIFGAGQLALQLPDGTRVLVTAAMCGSCGDVRLTAEGARHLYEAMRRHRG